MSSPIGLALVICDSLYRDVPGNKPALIGLFSNVTAGTFPATHARMCVYASVTEVRENSKFRLELSHSETDESVISVAGPPMDGVSPLQIIDMFFDLSALTFKTPGLYFMRLWANDHLVLQRPVSLIEARKQGKESGK